MWFSSLLPLIESGIRLFLKYRNFGAGDKLSFQAARTYVESVRAARMVALVVAGLTIAAALNVFALCLFTHAVYLVSDPILAPSHVSWITFEFITSGIIWIADILAFFLVLSNQAWMRLFKIPQLIEKMIIQPRIIQ